MKEFIKTKKVTYNLMSFTAFKTLVLFSELTKSPKSYQEICDIFYNHPYLREQISIDTFRVYMNSLKRLGCELKRVKGEDKISRYTIVAHPFELNYTEEQLQSALKVLKSLVKNMDIEELISMEEFFEKIGKYIKNEDFINEAKKISLLKDVNKELLKQILECCRNKSRIIISYDSPNSGKKNIEILTDKVEISNGKIYLFGTGFEYRQYASFLVNRIKDIVEIKPDTSAPENLKKIKIVYEILNNKNIELQEYETLIERADDKMTIETNVSNLFLLRQRLLALGPNCRIIRPEDFKTDFIKLLKNMKAGYYRGE